MSWKLENDIGFEKPPSLSKMSLLIIHSKLDFFLTPPPLFAHHFFCRLFFLKSSLMIFRQFWAVSWKNIFSPKKIPKQNFKLEIYPMVYVMHGVADIMCGAVNWMHSMRCLLFQTHPTTKTGKLHFFNWTLP